MKGGKILLTLHLYIKKTPQILALYLIKLMGYLKITTDVSHFSWHPLYQTISQTRPIKQLKSSLALATSILGEEIPFSQLKFLEKIQCNWI